MVLGGEDKAVRSLMNIAVAELLEKHKGATAALYGNLGYIILIATAGEAVRVFALELGPEARLLLLIPEFTVRAEGQQWHGTVHKFCQLHLCSFVYYFVCLRAWAHMYMQLQRVHVQSSSHAQH